MTLDWYMLRRFLSIYAANLFSFTLLFILVDALSHLENFVKYTDSFGSFLSVCFKYYAAITPVMFCQILGPVVCVSAGLFAVTTFQRANEFAPILATGRSHQRTLFPILLASVVLCFVVFVIQETWVPRTVAAIRQAMESREGNDIDTNVKHLDLVHGNLIVFRNYERFHRSAKGVLVLPVSRRGGNQVLIQAESAEWKAPEFAGQGSVPGYWLLHKGTVQEYTPDARLVTYPPPKEWAGAKPRLFENFVERKLESDLIPADLEMERVEETFYLTLSQLRRKAETSPDQNVWLIKYFSRFAYAATNFILILLGLPVIVYFGNRNIFFGALVAVAISTSYFVVNSICQDFGIRGYVPARLGAGLAPMFFTALGATLYRGMRS